MFVICTFVVMIISLNFSLTCPTDARNRHESICQLYTQLSLYTIVLWIMYPIFFALGEGTGRISSDAEAVVYTILDMLIVIVFGLWLLIRHKHDSEEESAVMLSETWTEPWGLKTGVIQLAVGGCTCYTVYKSDSHNLYPCIRMEKTNINGTWD